MPLVIGFGNPLRQDDGLGFHAVAALREAGVRAELLHVQQLTPELTECVAATDKVIFLDASTSRPPGEMLCQAVGPAPELGVVSRGLSPAMLLLYAQRLHGHVPPAVLVSVGGESFGMGEQLSARLQEVLPKVLRCVLCILQGEEQGLVRLQPRARDRKG